MRRHGMIPVLLLSALLAACNSADDDIAPIVVNNPPVVSNVEVTSEDVTFMTQCDAFILSGVTFELRVTVVQITAEVSWFDQSTCLQGPDAGQSCILDSDCADLGYCSTEMFCLGGAENGTDCTDDPSICSSNVCSNTCVGGADAGDACDSQAPADQCADKTVACGDPADRLVFATTVIDTVTNTETGVVLFDDGSVPVQLEGGTTFVTSGDLVAQDGVYTRKIGFVSSVLNGDPRTCIEEDLEITGLKVNDMFFDQNNVGLLEFRIDVVDGATGLAKLTTVLPGEIPGQPVPVKQTDCCLTAGADTYECDPLLHIPAEFLPCPI